MADILQDKIASITSRVNTKMNGLGLGSNDYRPHSTVGGPLSTTTFQDPIQYEDSNTFDRGVNALQRASNEYLGTDFDTTENRYGKRLGTTNKTFNEDSLETLQGHYNNLEEDPNAEQSLYYLRINNPDGTSSYKMGLAGIDAVDRYKEQGSIQGEDGTTFDVLMDKRVTNAEEFENYVHGNKGMIEGRRTDLGMKGTDDGTIGSGYTEVYNSDFLNLDNGTITQEKMNHLNMSRAKKYKSLYGEDAYSKMTADNEALETAKNEGIFTNAAKNLTSSSLEILADTAGSLAKVVVAGGDKSEIFAPIEKGLRDAKEWVGYVSQSKSPAALIQAYKLKGMDLGLISDAIRTGVDITTESLPYMAGLSSKAGIKGLTTLITSTTNDIADDIAKNDGREGQVGYADLLQASTTATAAILTEKVAFDKIFGIAGKSIKDVIPKGMTEAEFRGKAAAGIALGVTSKLAQAIGIEGTQEVIQGVITDIGSTVGTEAGIEKGIADIKEQSLERFVGGALAGGTTVAGAQAVTGTAKVIKGAKDGATKFKDTKQQKERDVLEGEVPVVDETPVETTPYVTDTFTTSLDEAKKVSTAGDYDSALKAVNTAMTENNKLDPDSKEYTDNLVKIGKVFQDMKVDKATIDKAKAGDVKAKDNVLGSMKVGAIDYDEIKSELAGIEKDLTPEQQVIVDEFRTEGKLLETVKDSAKGQKNEKQVLHEIYDGPKGIKTYVKQLRQAPDENTRSKVLGQVSHFLGSQATKLKRMNDGIKEFEATGRHKPVTISEGDWKFTISVDAKDGSLNAAKRIAISMETAVNAMTKIFENQSVGTKVSIPPVVDTDVTTDDTVLEKDTTISRKPVPVKVKETTTAPKAEIVEPTVEAVAEKIAAGEKLDKADLQVQANEGKAVEQVLQEKAQNPGKTVLANTSTEVQKQYKAVDTDMDFSKVDEKTMKPIVALKNKLKKILTAELFMYGTPKGKNFSKKQAPGRLLMDKDGNFSEEVWDAMALTMVDVLANGLTTTAFNDDAQIKKMLGIRDGMALPASVRDEMVYKGSFYGLTAQSMGGQILANLGIKQEGTTKRNEIDRLAADMGGMLIHALEADGYLEFDQILAEDRKAMTRSIEEYNQLSEKQTAETGDEIIFDDTSENKSYANTVRVVTDEDGDMSDTMIKRIELARKIMINLKAEMGIESYIKEPRTEKRTKNRVHSVKGMEDVAEVPKKQQKVLNKLENIRYEVAGDRVEVLANMYNEDKQGTLKLLGWVDPKTIQIDFRSNTEGKNRAIEKSIEMILEADPESDMYFDWFFSKNGRFFIDSTTVNPQTDKLHRFMVDRDGQESTIDSDEKRASFKLAVVQAFDGTKLVAHDELGNEISNGNGVESTELGAIDKQSEEASIKNFDEILANPDVQAAIKKPNTKNLMKIAKGADHPGHVIMAVLELSKYKDGKFKTSMTLETDAVTSGFILGIASNPVMEYEKLKGWLSKGGIWLGGTDANSFGEYAETNLDSYQTGVTGVAGKLKKSKDSEALKPIIGELIGTDGTVTGKGRKFMKLPFMTFIYGSSIANIVKSISINYADEVIKGLGTKEGYATSIEVAKNLGFDAQENFEYYRDTKMSENKGMRQLHNEVQRAVADSYGVAVAEYMEEEFGELVDLKTNMNKAFVDMFVPFKKEFDRRMAKSDGSKDAQDRVLKYMSKEGLVPSLFTINSDSNADKAPMVKKEKIKDKNRITELKVQGAYDKKLDNKDKVINPVIRELVAAPSSGAVTGIHWLDGSIMTAVLAEYDGLGVHDALVSSMDDAVNTAKKYNQTTADMTQSYSVVESILENKNISTRTRKALVGALVLIKANKAKIAEDGMDIEHMSMPRSKLSIAGTKAEFGLDKLQKANPSVYNDIIAVIKEFKEC